MISPKFLSFALFLTLMLTFVACENETTNSDDDLYWNKKIAQEVVHTHAVMLGETLKGEPTEAEKIALICTSIDSVRFYDDESGYFYVYDYDCVNIAHATQKDLQGQNLYNYQDTHGKYVIRELSAAAQNGGGFVEFYWIKPGSTGEKKKLGYVEPIPGTDYFIDTGVYLE
ncbi:MAG: C50 carotenoid epsilon cyclase [Candidatus Marinimicrobia bacterium CG08_land_8_20_14_0_20_45_22]|nr:MAG: C50 carotenoid epsilon cyclase [Candidatus Marinimicrobia bacterium CG08_land_8_20_14_0_20_45_22]